MREKLAAVRRKATGVAIEGFFRGMSAGARLHPRTRRALQDLEIVRDLPYDDDDRDAVRRLDVYRPMGVAGSLPVVLHVHGGGFRILSKDTHWLMGLAFARRGFLVFNIDYRLAPAHPYPAAVEDVCRAYEWVLDNAERFGGDSGKLVLAGESAGGNLVTAATLATCFERPEPFARSLFERDHRPLATVPFCGLLQASDLDRFTPRVSTLVRDRMAEIEQAYLADTEADRFFADPLLALESEMPTARPLPPFFAPVGTADPILDDTRRLGAALERRGVPHEVRYYRGEVHAFHAFVFRANARQCWDDTFTFLDRVIGGGA